MNGLLWEVILSLHFHLWMSVISRGVSRTIHVWLIVASDFSSCTASSSRHLEVSVLPPMQISPHSHPQQMSCTRLPSNWLCLSFSKQIQPCDQASYLRQLNISISSASAFHQHQHFIPTSAFLANLWHWGVLMMLPKIPSPSSWVSIGGLWKLTILLLKIKTLERKWEREKERGSMCVCVCVWNRQRDGGGERMLFFFSATKNPVFKHVFSNGGDLYTRRFIYANALQSKSTL